MNSFIVLVYGPSSEQLFVPRSIHSVWLASKLGLQPNQVFLVLEPNLAFFHLDIQVGLAEFELELALVELEFGLVEQGLQLVGRELELVVDLITIHVFLVFLGPIQVFTDPHVGHPIQVFLDPQAFMVFLDRHVFEPIRVFFHLELGFDEQFEFDGLVGSMVDLITIQVFLVFLGPIRVFLVTHVFQLILVFVRFSFPIQFFGLCFDTLVNFSNELSENQPKLYFFELPHFLCRLSHQLEP